MKEDFSLDEAPVSRIMRQIRIEYIGKAVYVCFAQTCQNIKRRSPRIKNDSRNIDHYQPVEPCVACVFGVRIGFVEAFSVNVESL